MLCLPDEKRQNQQRTHLLGVQLIFREMCFWGYKVQFYWDLDHLSSKKLLKIHILGSIFDQIPGKHYHLHFERNIIQRYKSLEKILRNRNSLER